MRLFWIVVGVLVVSVVVAAVVARRLATIGDACPYPVDEAHEPEET